MKTVSLETAMYVKQIDPSVSKSFNDVANYIWRDNLPFNIFDGNGYYTQDAKDFVKDKGIVRKEDETWADAIFRYAERYNLGYQVDKAPTKRSDVKFSGSMILSNYMQVQDDGNEYRVKNTDGQFEEGIDLIEELTVKSYQ